MNCDGAMAQSAAIPVEIKGEPGNFSLYRAGEPYLVRGAGTQSVDDLASLARHGANSVRTWAVGDGSVLDKAQELRMTVALCLDMKRERHGFDYDDSAAVDDQFKRLREQVLAHRDHPALLVWIIGNELNHDYRNPAVYDAVNDISKMIHRLDGIHPTTTTTAGIDASLARVIEARAPDLDFLSVQVYGGLFDLPGALSDIRLEMPLMVTEWGTIGHWEVQATSWGAPIEPTSTEKARRFRAGYERVLAPMGGGLIGNYAFLWGQKQERTPTWYGVLTEDGQRTEAADTLRQIWTGQWPVNRAPQVHDLTVDGKRAEDEVRLSPGGAYVATVQAVDPRPGQSCLRLADHAGKPGHPSRWRSGNRARGVPFAERELSGGRDFMARAGGTGRLPPLRLRGRWPGRRRARQRTVSGRRNLIAPGGD